MNSSKEFIMIYLINGLNRAEKAVTKINKLIDRKNLKSIHYQSISIEPGLTVTFEPMRLNLKTCESDDITQTGIIGAETLGTDEIIINIHNTADKLRNKNPELWTQVLLYVLNHELIHVEQFNVSCNKIGYIDVETDDVYFNDPHELAAFVSDIIHQSIYRNVNITDTERFVDCLPSLSRKSLNRLYKKLFVANSLGVAEAIKNVHAKRYIYPQKYQ